MPEPYEFQIEGLEEEYQSPALEGFEGTLYLRVAEPDMPPDDSFYIEIPRSLGDRPISSAIEHAFPGEDSKRAERKDDLEIDEYPELPDLYDHLAHLVEEERKGNIVIDWSPNFGPRNVSLDDIVNSHSLHSTDEEGEEYQILHLIADVYETPFKEYDDADDIAQDKQTFRGLFLHYMVVAHGLDSIHKSSNTGPVKDALDWCKKENILNIEDDGDLLKLTMTNQGERFVDSLRDENDYYAENYEIFARVNIEEDFVEFGVDGGYDLRWIAMRQDEINPYRGLMVVNMFTGAFDDVAERWEEELRSDRFFGRYLGDAAVTDVIFTQEELDTVMEQARD